MDETLRVALSDNVSIIIPSPQTVSTGTHGRSGSCGLHALEAWTYKSVVCVALILYYLSDV
jgi:hypothetical protein